MRILTATLALLAFAFVLTPEPALAAGLASVTAQAGGQEGKITAFFESLFAGMQTIGIAIGVLMAGWAGIKIATGQRDGMEKLVYAGIGVFILLMAKPIIDLVQAATR
ncbi:MAG: TrbC/VirB2 family protein [Chloroflexota bacterium]|nr:TrbC/VirB2 family protein [Chloroflexota bacterium]